MIKKINKNYIKAHYIEDIEEIKTNLIKIGSAKDHNNQLLKLFQNNYKEDVFMFSLYIYVSGNENFIFEIEEELKQNKEAKIKDLVNDIPILNKLKS